MADAAVEAAYVMDTQKDYLNLDEPAGLKNKSLLNRLLDGSDLTGFFADFEIELENEIAHGRLNKDDDFFSFDEEDLKNNRNFIFA